MEILKDYEGIIGALSGVIVTLILTQLFKVMGKLRFYVLNEAIYVFKKEEQDEIGATQIVDSDKENCNILELDFELEVYNGSETPKILRDIRIVFKNDKETLVKFIPKDKSTKQQQRFGTTYDELTNINVPSKQILTIGIHKYISDEKIEKIKECNVIYLEARNHKGKTIKVKLGSIH